jgi:hypothetical protein
MALAPVRLTLAVLEVIYSRPLGSSSLPVEAEAWVGGIEAQLREAQSSLCAGLATAGDEDPTRRKRAPRED